jgi:hypothetical protein
MAMAASPSSSRSSVICAPGALDVGGGEIDLVDDGDDLEAAVQCQVIVGERLRLDALGGVHDEKGSLAGGQGARHLVGEVHVPRGVDEVEGVFPAVLGHVQQPDGVGLDGDPPLLLEIHRVQHLPHRLLRVHGPRQGQEPVGQGGLAVVDVRDD